MTTPEQQVRHRSIRIPSLMRLVRGHHAVVDALRDLPIGEHGSYLVVHSGDRSPTAYGETIARAAEAAGVRVSDCVIDANTRTSVRAVADHIAALRPDYVLGVGGGRVLDVAKLAAAEADVEFISIPTQVSSDGICSPVAVIVAADGRVESVGARIPAGIVVDMDMLDRAPRSTWLSGLGDLVSNLSAVRDWYMAREQYGEPVDDFACLTAEAAALSVVEDDASLDDATYRQKLIRGLILSGIAMEMAGSTRPASGSEHLISHALDATLDRPRPHGLQVAMGTAAAFVLRGEDNRRLIAFMRRVGLPVVPADLGLDVETLLEAVRHGPATRPGRTTMLDRVDEADLQRLREWVESEEA